MDDQEKSKAFANAFDAEVDVRKTGNLAFVEQQGGNESAPMYQEASGAPVETRSPLGYDVKWFTIIFLNIGQMIGTGVFSTPSSILSGTGSVGLALIYWFIGLVMSACGLAIYIELASYFPARSGAEAVYLEQAFPRPRYFFPITFAIQTVILSFSASNAIVLSQYLWAMTTHTATAWELKGVAIAAYTLAVLFVIVNNRLSLFLSDLIGAIKVLTLIFIALTGFVVLGGHTSVSNPTANFQNAFAGSGSAGGNGTANALVKITFAYAGFANAFQVTNEIRNPIRTIKKSAPASLFIVGTLYILCNVAYFAAVPKAALLAANATTASLFFTNVFNARAAKALNILIIISAFGNLISVMIGQSRLIREVGRQGALPFAEFWSSTRPFGTPTAPYLLKWILTLVMIIAPPAGDAFNFVVDLANYPSSIFLFLMSIGLYLIRRERFKVGLGRAEFRAWDVAVVFYILVLLFQLVMPWYPPKGGPYAGDVSFWYATYCAVGIGIIILCAFYYWVWVWLLPRLGHYSVRQQVITLDDGSVLQKLVKVPTDQVHEWDAEHDVSGRSLKSG